MGLPTKCRDQLRDRYPEAFSFEGPAYQMVCIDMMQFIKGSLPDWVVSLAALKRMFYNKIDQHFKTKALVVVLCFDKGTPDVKKLVVHKTRYEKRCAECKKTGVEMPAGKSAGQECFSPTCERQCFYNQTLWASEGPYLSMVDENDPLPNWARFSADSNNLRNELYPLFMNWVLQYVPQPGQVLLTSGLPCGSRVVMDYSKDFHLGFHSNHNIEKRTILVPWRAEQLPLSPDVIDYNKVYMMKGVAPSPEHPQGHLIQEEVPDMYNTIHEADNAVFFFSRFFPELKVYMAHINDGDAISIGLLRTMEDFTGAQDPFHHQWLALRYSNTKGKNHLLSMGYEAPSIEYINLTVLYRKIEETSLFKTHGVQSPAATLIFLLIIAGSDFFQGEFCYGIGTVENAKGNSVWDTFFNKLGMFSHLVQYYPETKSLTERRRIVVDEDLFAVLVNFCYTEKYAKQAKGKDIQVYCSTRKNPKEHYPTDARIKRWARQIGWNLDYWANAFRDIYIDPFEEHLGAPLWGYHRELGIVDVVSSKPKKLDEVHKRHLLRRKKKEEDMVPIQPAKKKRAMDAIRGH